VGGCHGVDEEKSWLFAIKKNSSKSFSILLCFAINFCDNSSDIKAILPSSFVFVHNLSLNLISLLLNVALVSNARSISGGIKGFVVLNNCRCLGSKGLYH
jgi:hypothetical protein